VNGDRRPAAAHPRQQGHDTAQDAAGTIRHEDEVHAPRRRPTRESLETTYNLVGRRGSLTWDSDRVKVDVQDHARRIRFLFEAGFEAEGHSRAITFASAVAVIAIEVASPFVGALAAAYLDTALALGFLALFVVQSRIRAAHLLPVMAVVALIRPVGLAVMIPKVPELGLYLLSGGPLLAGALLTVRFFAEPARQLHLRLTRPKLDALLVAEGVPAGFIAYLFLQPAPLVEGWGPAEVATVVVTLLVFAGLLEELLLRGLLQGAATWVLGKQWQGMAVATAVSMALYWSCGSVPYLLLMGLLAAQFGAALASGASLWGVATSRATMLLTMQIIAVARAA
jgi:hypothetical protein